MSVITTALETVFKKHSIPMLRKTLAAVRTAGLLDTESGLKQGSNTVTIETPNLILMDNGEDRGDAISSGNTTLGNIQLIVDPIYVQQNVNQKALEKKFESFLFTSGQKQSETSIAKFAAEYIAEKISVLGIEVDKMIWRGNKSLTGNLGRTNGILKLLYDVSGSTNNLSSSAITETNAIQVCKAYFDKLPASGKSGTDITMFVGHDDFILIRSAMATAGLTFTNHENAHVFGLDFTFRPMRIEAVHGLDGTGRKIVVASKSLIKLGTDLSNDMQEGGVSFFHSEDKNTHIYRHEFAIGATVAFPSLIVNDML